MNNLNLTTLSPINNITKRGRGRPKLSDEEKILQLQKRKEYQRKYKLENKDKIYKQNIEYTNNNIEKIKISRHKHYINNKDKYIEHAKNHRNKIQDELKQNKLLIEHLLSENKQLIDSCKKLQM